MIEREPGLGLGEGSPGLLGLGEVGYQQPQVTVGWHTGPSAQG
ncbi:hypothetical protein [Trichothermofontia sp.]